MNTKILLSTSSLALGLLGVIALFAPMEILTSLGAASVNPLSVLIQLLGSLYFAFALANWTAKDSRMGGIYSRPLALGNCVHFVTGALVILQYELANGFRGSLTVAFIGYAIFAASFTYLVFWYDGL